MSTVTTTARQNWVSGETHEVLAHIHESEVNIAIFNRSIGTLTEELNRLVQKDLEIKISGELEVILDRVDKDEALADCSLIKQDIQEQLRYFREVSQAKSYRLLLATVNTNMCRKFHTDLNDLRLLCTYSGPGTLWLREDNVNREALHGSEEELVLDADSIQQAETGAVIILKGAIYPKEGTQAVLHRSPTIEESGERRLLLRIDTDEFLNF